MANEIKRSRSLSFTVVDSSVGDGQVSTSEQLTNLSPQDETPGTKPTGLTLGYLQKETETNAPEVVDKRDLFNLDPIVGGPVNLDTIIAINTPPRGHKPSQFAINTPPRGHKPSQVAINTPPRGHKPSQVAINTPPRGHKPLTQVAINTPPRGHKPDNPEINTPPRG